MFTAGKANQKPLQIYLKIALGTAILSFGLYNIHEPSGITEGGLLGLALLLDHWWGISPGLSSLIMNVVCYLAGLRFLGREFLKRSIVAAVFYSAFFTLWEQFPPLLPSMAKHPMLAALIGAVFVGVGVGLAVTAGSAPGGDDSLAMVMARLTGRPISKMYLVCDLVVLALSLSYIPVFNIICSLVTVTLSSFIIGRFSPPACCAPASQTEAA